MNNALRTQFTRHLSLICIIFLCVIMWSYMLHAQAPEALPNQKAVALGEQSEVKSNESSEPILHFGMMTYWNASMSISSVPVGWQVQPRVASMPEISLHCRSALYSLGGFIPSIDIGYGTRSAGFISYYANNALQSDSASRTFSADYLWITPGGTYQYFYAGLAIGIPVSSSVSAVNGSEQLKKSTDSPALSTLIELRLGAEIPVLEDSHGTLLFRVFAGVGLTPYYSSFSGRSTSPFPGTLVTTTNNPRLANLSVGIGYVFGL